MKKFIYMLALVAAFTITASAQSSADKEKTLSFGGVFVGSEYQQPAQKVFTNIKTDNLAFTATALVKFRPLKVKTFYIRGGVVQPYNNFGRTDNGRITVGAPQVRFSIETRLF